MEYLIKNQKKIKQIKRKESLFKKGDVLQVRFSDGTYSGAVVLDDIISSEEYCSNLIVKSTLKSESEVSPEEILGSSIYNYAWYIKVNYKKYVPQIKVISNVQINKDYSICTGPGSLYSGWVTFVSENSLNAQSLQENSDIKNLSDFLKLEPSELKERQNDHVRNKIKSLGIK